ncbi:MAG: type II toxin-antitoxin system HicA family toxin [Chloroflexi bacterium]|nr:type II toxin-antitoxin system HicA family toxin [Chloroflexota bacterium]MYE31160.1 type II toxin-antitoxin system HicA family toxin [Chloroflexota bacterium]
MSRPAPPRCRSYGASRSRSPPVRPLPYREVARRLIAAGFVQRGQRGSHVKFTKQQDDGTLVAIVPRHREVEAGTLRSIIRQAGLTAREFDRL